MLLSLEDLVVGLYVDAGAGAGPPRPSTLVHHGGLDVDHVQTRRRERQQELAGEVVIMGLHHLVHVIGHILRQLKYIQYRCSKTKHSLANKIHTKLLHLHTVKPNILRQLKYIQNRHLEVLIFSILLKTAILNIGVEWPFF